jgi:archaellum component FlaF (FlaF/FlaG flagellin family)
MRNRYHARRGVSSILGAVMFLSILFTGFGLIVWNSQIYDAYVQVANAREYLYNERIAENVAITGLKFTQNKLSLTAKNEGPVTARIVRIWIDDNSISPSSHVRYDVNYFLNPGESITLGQQLGTFNAGHLYTIKLITSRGNIFGATNFGQSAIVGIAQGMGWLTIDWDTYYYTDNNYCIADTCTWKPAWNISETHQGQGRIQFRINVTNHWDRNVTLTKYTYLRFETDSGSTGDAPPFYIMAPGSTPLSPSCYTGPGTPIIVPYNNRGDFSKGGTPITILFMDVGYYKGGQCNVPSNKPPAAHYYSAYIVVYYTYKDPEDNKIHTMAQTIPFEATGYP